MSKQIAGKGIAWTDETWNPIRGCSRVSEGCRHCYAESTAHRFSGPGKAYEGLVQLGTSGKSKGLWNGQIRFVQEHLLDPLKWGPVLTGIAHGEGELKHKAHRDGSISVTRERSRRIFVNSMSDLFHENVTDEMRDKIFAVMGLAPHHTFQVLTKRPERMLEYLGRTKAEQAVREAMIGFQISQIHLARTGEPVSEWAGMPLPNAWLGISGEDLETVTKRSWVLLETPAAIRWLSLEPMLGPVDLHAGDLICKTWRKGATLGRYLDWVVVGGESGHDARPMHPEWVRTIRDQCVAEGVAFFFKQWGEYRTMETGMEERAIAVAAGAPMRRKPECRNFPSVLRVPVGDFAIKVGKKGAGRELDGQIWNEMPGGTA